jgi:hypothetical protein
MLAPYKPLCEGVGMKILKIIFIFASALFSFNLLANYCSIGGKTCTIQSGGPGGHGCCPTGNNPTTGNPYPGSLGSACGFSTSANCNYSYDLFHSAKGSANSCFKDGEWCTISSEGGAAHGCCGGSKLQSGINWKGAPSCTYDANDKCNKPYVEPKANYCNFGGKKCYIGSNASQIESLKNQIKEEYIIFNNDLNSKNISMNFSNLDSHEAWMNFVTGSGYVEWGNDGIGLYSYKKLSSLIGQYKNAYANDPARHACANGGNNPKTGDPFNGPYAGMSECGFIADSRLNYSKEVFDAGNSTCVYGTDFCTITEGEQRCCSESQFLGGIHKKTGATACKYNSIQNCSHAVGQDWACNPTETTLTNKCGSGDMDACVQACKMFGVECKQACKSGNKTSCCIAGGSQDNINDCVTACNLGELKACKNVCNNQSGIQKSGYLTSKIKKFKDEACARIEAEYNQRSCLGDAKAKKHTKDEVGTAQAKVTKLETEVQKTKQEFLAAYGKVKTEIYNYIHPNSAGMTLVKLSFDDKLQDTIDYYGYVQGGMGTENISAAAKLARQYKTKASDLATAKNNLSEIKQSTTESYDGSTSGSIAMHCPIVNNFCKKYGQVFAISMQTYNPCNPVYWQCLGGISSSCTVFADMCNTVSSNQVGACYQSSLLCAAGITSLCQPVTNFCASTDAEYPVGPMKFSNPCTSVYDKCKKGDGSACNAIKSACTNSNNNYQDGACYQLGALCADGVSSACTSVNNYCEKNPSYPTNYMTGNSTCGWVYERCKKGHQDACASIQKTCDKPGVGQTGACWQLGALCLSGIGSACQPVNNYCKNYGSIVAQGFLNWQPCNAVYWNCKKGNADSCKVFTDVCGDSKSNNQKGACYQAGQLCSEGVQSACNGLTAQCKKTGNAEACKPVVNICKKDTTSPACSAVNDACQKGSKEICKPLVSICNDNYKKMGCAGVHTYCANEIKNDPSQINKFSKTGVCGSYINNIASSATGATRVSALGILLDTCKAKPLSESCWTWTAQMTGNMDGVKGQGRKPLSTVTKECAAGNATVCNMLWDLHLYAAGGNPQKGKDWLKVIADTSTRKQALTELESVCNGTSAGKNIACNLISKNCTIKNMFEYHWLDISGQKVDKTKQVVGACASMQNMCESGNSAMCSKIGCATSAQCGILASSCKAGKAPACAALADSCYGKKPNSLACKNLTPLCVKGTEASCSAIATYCGKGNSSACNILIAGCSKGKASDCTLLQIGCKAGSKVACSGLYKSLDATCKAGNKTACAQLQTDCKAGVKLACNALYSTLQASCVAGTQAACTQLQTDCKSGSKPACVGLYDSLAAGCKVGKKANCTDIISDCVTKKNAAACSAAESFCQKGVYPICAGLCQAGKAASCSKVNDACYGNNLSACHAITDIFKLGSTEINNVQSYCKSGVENACMALVDFCNLKHDDMTPDGIDLCGTICRATNAGTAAPQACVALSDLCVYQQDVDACVQAAMPTKVAYNDKDYWMGKVKAELADYCKENPSDAACEKHNVGTCAAIGKNCDGLFWECKSGNKSVCSQLVTACTAHPGSAVCKQLMDLCDSEDKCQPALDSCKKGNYSICVSLAMGHETEVHDAAAAGCKLNNAGACKYLSRYQGGAAALKTACTAGASNACKYVPKAAPTKATALLDGCQNNLTDCNKLCASQATSAKPTGCWKLYDDCKSSGGVGNGCSYLQSLCSANNKNACWQLRELAPTYQTYVLNNLYESCRALPDASDSSKWGSAYGWPCQYLFDVCTKNNVSKACGQVATACQGNNIPACMSMYWLFDKYLNYKTDMVSYCSKGNEAACQFLTEEQLQSISSSSNGAKYLQMCKDKKTLACS